MVTVPLDEKSEDTLNSDILRQTAQTLGMGLAVVDPDTWSILFENANFFKWFPPGSDADEPLTDRLHSLNVGRAQSRLKDGRPFNFETEVQPGGRSVSLSVDLRQLPDNPHGYVVVECKDITKQKQSEYMLESYSQMAEKNTRDLSVKRIGWNVCC